MTRFGEGGSPRTVEVTAGKATALTNTPWRLRAACDADSGNWALLPRIGVAAQRIQRAYEIEICQTCPVQPDCLEYAMTTKQPTGIWGGLLPKERATLRRKRTSVDPRCGTVAGHSAHRRREERPCDACRLAFNRDHLRYKREKAKT